MKKKILFVDFGGLGDHLAWSTIPETCHNNGYDFYLSDKSVFKSQETFDLVWNQNPFFKGIIAEEPNCGHNNYTNLEGYNDEISTNKNLEEKMGFSESTLEHGSKYPVIYYQPTFVDKFEDSLLIDFNGVHVAGHGYVHNWDKIKNHVEDHIRNSNYKNVYFILPNTTNYSKMSLDFVIGESITVNNIFEYADIIYSSKSFFTLWSGGSHLSSAIKWKYKQELSVYTFTDNLKKSCFWYDNIEYLNGYMK